MTSLAKLFLVVSNPEQLTHGSRPLFGPVEHNTIISNDTTTGWRLHDATGQVRTPHAAIQIIDNRYVLVDLCGYTYIWVETEDTFFFCRGLLRSWSSKHNITFHIEKFSDKHLCEKKQVL